MNGAYSHRARRWGCTVRRSSLRQPYVTIGMVVLPLLVLLGVVLLLAGCGGPMRFAKPGAGAAELQRDEYECNEQWEHTAGAIAFRLDPMGNLYHGMQARTYLEQCLTHRGWTRTDG